ncbi:MAG: hypothetical protein MI757_08265, partial [Pirellulales bacterium]|nr:hypothetical protein [Pirellulales bacterium]
MPVELCETTRRRFLLGLSSASLATIGLEAYAEASASHDPHRFALLADTHVPGNPKATNRGTNMYDNLAAVSKQLA